MPDPSKWTPLTPVEIAELKTEKFSQAEACYITGISPERLLTWHKAGIAPETRGQKGRGNRRKYNFYQLAWITAMRLLTKRGLPLKDAKNYAEVILVERIAEAFDEISKATSIDAAEQLDIPTVVVYDLQEQEGAEQYRFEVFLRGASVVSEAPSLDAWMCKESINDVIYIHVGGLALGLRFWIDEVIERRGTASWREELRQFMTDFKRAVEPKKPWQQRMNEVFVDALNGKPYTPERPFRTAKDARKRVISTTEEAKT